MTRDEFSAGLGRDVSRETYDRLVVFSEMVARWNKTINLVGSASLTDFWYRHILDSAQVVHFAPRRPQHWADLGSGAGLPGLVVAAFLATESPRTRVSLVESDARKAVFLEQAAREMNLMVSVHKRRIETLDPLVADVISARALASIDVLLGFAHRHLDIAGVAIYMKGAGCRGELNQAQSTWRFEADVHPSVTAKESAIVLIRNIRHV